MVRGGEHRRRIAGKAIGDATLAAPTGRQRDPGRPLASSADEEETPALGG